MHGDTQKRPPWVSMIDRQIDNLMPTPSGFVVKKRSKMRSVVAGSTPLPVSLTATRNPLGSTGSDVIASTFGRSVTMLIASTFNAVHYQIQQHLLQPLTLRRFDNRYDIQLLDGGAGRPGTMGLGGGRTRIELFKLRYLPVGTTTAPVNLTQRRSDAGGTVQGSFHRHRCGENAFERARPPGHRALK
jgi:hypothetical protein